MPEIRTYVDAGVVGDHIELACRSGNLTEQPCHVLPTRNVGSDWNRSQPVLDEGGGGGLRARPVDVGKEDARTLFREDPAYRVADSSGSPRHQCNFAFEATHHKPVETSAVPDARRMRRTAVPLCGNPHPSITEGW